MKRYLTKLLNEYMRESGYADEVNQYAGYVMPVIFFAGAATTFYFAFTYWRSYQNWEGEGEAPKAILLSVAVMAVAGLGMAGFGVSLFF